MMYKGFNQVYTYDDRYNWEAGNKDGIRVRYTPSLSEDTWVKILILSK